MKITINGAEKEVPESASLCQLIELLGLDSSRVAIEINRRIVRRADWKTTAVKSGDAIEIVTFVGGGSEPF